MAVSRMNAILTMGGASDGALSIGGESATEISGSIGSASATAVSGAQLMLEQGNVYSNNQYGVRQQDSHLAPVCVTVIRFSDLESISIGDGVGGLEGRKMELNLFLKVRVTLFVGMMMMRYRW